MCLLAVAWNAHPRYRLVLAANRDEFHARPTAPVARWDGDPPIIAGRDLQAGGTWLGVGPDRRLGVVTNFREPSRPAPGAPSRGELIPGFLANGHGPDEFLGGVAARAAGYAGFNLLLADRRQLWYASNRTGSFARPLAAGIYGLSNGLIDTPWPKLRRLRAGLEAWVQADPAPHAATNALLALLADDSPADPSELPQTGLPPEWEQRLSAPFVRHPDYGTRCSTVVLIGHDGAVELVERRFDPSGAVTGETGWRLAAEEWPAGRQPATATPPPPSP